MSDTIKKMRVRQPKKAEMVILHEQTGGGEVPSAVPVAEPKVKEIKIRKPRVKKAKGEVMALVDSSDDSVEESKSVEATETSPKKKPANNWIDHVKSFREAHPDVSYKDALKQAKETYKK
jgi:hypothetical protein